MNISLRGKVAIVTGASRGIGRAIAESLAAAGATVVINHRASKEQADEAVASIELAGGHAIAVQADMASVEQVRLLVDTSVKQLGRLDILVNNAGVGNRTAMADMTEREFDWTMSVNARGPMFAIQAATPHMRDGGRVINISSCGTHILVRWCGGGGKPAGGVSDVEGCARAVGAVLCERAWGAGNYDQFCFTGICGDGAG